MFGNFFAQANYLGRLRELEAERRPAHVRGGTECVRCAVCCWRRPPLLTPDDVKRLAEHEQLSPQEFFLRFCAVDEIGGVRAPVLLRAGQRWLGGKYMPSRETFAISSPCVYLSEGQTCCVHGDAKPTVCRTAGCWSPQTDAACGVVTWADEELKALGWDGDTDDYGDKWWRPNMKLNAAAESEKDDLSYLTAGQLGARVVVLEGEEEMSGYVNCGCRDCFEITIASDDGPALCSACEAAGCEIGDHECQCEPDLEDEEEDEKAAGPTVVSEDEYAMASEDNQGFCLNCREFTRDCTEPDAENYDCPKCRGRRVFGAEQALIRGDITF